MEVNNFFKKNISIPIDKRFCLWYYNSTTIIYAG